MSSFQTEYRIHYNETDLINQTQVTKPQDRIKKYRDTFSFEKKSFINDSLAITNINNRDNNFNKYERPLSFRYVPEQAQSSYLNVPLETSRMNSTTNTSHINQYNSLAAPLNASNQEVNTNTVYTQHFNYVGQEPHVSEKIKTYEGAFGPKQEEITQAYKFGNAINTNRNNYAMNDNNSSAKSSSSYSYNVKNSNRIQSGLMNNSNLNNNYANSNGNSGKDFLPPLVLSNEPIPQLQQSTMPTLHHNFLYNSINDRPNIRSHDFRPVWIPKKYPGRNMFYSHLDSSIFPGKYDVTEQVWNSLSEAHDTQREKSNSNSKLDQLLHSQPKTQIEQIRVPSFTKHTGFIINSLDKSILPVVKTENVRAAQITKTNKFIDESLYHYP